MEDVPKADLPRTLSEAQIEIVRLRALVDRDRSVNDLVRALGMLGSHTNTASLRMLSELGSVADIKQARRDLERAQIDKEQGEIDMDRAIATTPARAKRYAKALEESSDD